MKEITNSHDKFFKKVMSDKEIAVDFLKNYLPENILNLIDLKQIIISKDSFIEKELKEAFSDVLYEVKLQQKPAYIYFLIEHKSFSYPNITLQLLKYMIKIWELKLAQKSKIGSLPIIIPLVIYHGKLNWNIGLKLSNILQEVPQELKKYVPEFEYILYDLPNYDDSEIIGEIKLIMFLEMIKHIFGDEFFDKFKEIIVLSERLQKNSSGIEFFETFINYAMNAREDFSIKKFEKIKKEISIERSDKIMTLAERLENRGMKRGIQKGKKEGKLEGKLEGLIEGIEGMLDIKFGPVGLQLMNKLNDVSNIAKLEKIKNLLRTTNKIEDIEKLLAH